MNAVIYARYSSDSQREESIEGQLRECRDYAERNNMTIVGTYIDRALSAKTADRPEFQHMIKDSAKELFEIVLVWKLDRFSRDRYDSAHYKHILKKNGVKVISAKEHISEGPEGIILEAMLEGYAEFYSAELSEKIHRGQKENALKGKNNGGGVPLGYLLDKKAQKLLVDPTTAPLVVEVFEKYADGKSVRSIVEDFNVRGLRTKKGQPFNINSFSSLLKNRKYIGEYRYQDVVIEGGVPAIVPEDLFNRVQERIEKNRHAPAMAKAKEDYLLTTKLFCGKCERMMVGESGKSHTGAMHYYYKCSGAKRLKDCDKKAVRKDWIERVVVRLIMQRVMDEEKINRLIDAILVMQEQEDTTTPALRSQLAETESSIGNILKAIEQGIFTPSTKQRLDELEARKEEILVNIQTAELQKPKLTREQMTAWFEQFRHGDPENRDFQKRLIDTFVNSVYVFDDKLVLTYNYQHGTQTILLEEIESALGSDLRCGSPPMTRILLLRCSCYFYTHARFPNLRLIFTRYDKICIIIPEGDPMRILLAEDEKSLNRIITKQLKAAGYSVDSCFDGGEAYDLITSTDYDAAVFDVMMPIMNGFELVKKIRAHGIDTPVLFLTARDSIEDRVTGLDIGADDYLIKPFSFDELSARLRVMTRKKYGEKTGIISVGDLTVDTAARRVERAGREISLSAKEYELLQYLVMNKGVVLSREKIEDHIWNYDYEGGTNVVDVYIRYLRKKIDEGEDIKLIHTVRGAGYVIK